MRIDLRLLSLLFPVCATLSPGAVRADDLADREAAARNASAQLLQRLGGELKKEMGEKGPAAAIHVCRDLAPRIAGELSRDNGWRVTRVGTRVRNPLLGTPDAWEQGVLEDFAARAAQGEAFADMTRSEVVEMGGTRYFRFMKAIGTQPVCLTCHGTPEQIPGDVQARLAAEYPFDRAVGYRAGDLRGAVSILQPMDLPLLAEVPAR